MKRFLGEFSRIKNVNVYNIYNFKKVVEVVDIIGFIFLVFWAMFLFALALSFGSPYESWGDFLPWALRVIKNYPMLSLMSIILAVKSTIDIN